MNELLRLEHIQKIYGNGGGVTRAIDDISFSVSSGEFLGIMGASGSGKTTLLNCISTIDRPTSGSIQVDGEELTGLRGRALTRFRRERLGFIFQDCNLLDTLTAFENIALSLSILRTPAAQIRDRVEETAELLGIGDCLDKYPYQMSGGQQQRCAAARAIVTRPALVLADEPTGALDSHTGREVLTMLQQLHAAGNTVVLITHDNSIAVQAQRIIRLEDGHVIYDGDAGAPEAVVTPNLAGRGMAG